MKTSQGQIPFTKEPYIEDVGPRKIKSITFSMFSESEISKASEVQIWKGSYYDSFKKPIENGLLDGRMGPANKGFKCTTCDGTFVDCPGHFGCLYLVLPVYNVGYMGMIVDILKCICKSCARILLEEELSKKFLKKMRGTNMDVLRKNEVKKSVVKKCNSLASTRKAVKCPRCGFINGMVKRASGVLGIIHDRSKISNGSFDECRAAIAHMRESKASFTLSDFFNPIKVLSLFRRMPDEDCELLYMSDRPEKLIITNILVPPIAIRPSVVVDGGRSNENDITERLKVIIQRNASLRQELVETISTAKALVAWEFLQIEVAQYINSDVRGVPLAIQAAKPLSGFVQRLKGKQGRFRGNLSGKRVEYTGRTVISPDPNLKITEVAVPMLMARVLTYPECVSRYNIEKLRQYVRNGVNKYPGAKMIRYPDGSMSHLKFTSKQRAADGLKPGCIVERHLEDGDIVLFNRQPSLHRMSIMCHRARIMPWRTLRFNESVCNPYNADFDGDEMNMHVPQTEEARTEALMLMGVQNNLCTPKNGEILVASTQDFLTSSFLITRRDTFYDRATFSLICCYMNDGMDHIDLPTPAVIKPVELWTGKQIFNVLLRPNASTLVFVNLTTTEKTYRSGETMCPNDGFVYFRNSELVSGQLGKATLGNGNKDGLYSVLIRDYGAHAAAACMNRLAKLSARWIGNHGFSIGIDDVQPKEGLIKQKGARISEGYEQCDDLIRSFNDGELKPQPGCDAAQTLEAKITGVLNDIREAAAKVCMKELHWRNSPLIMSQCGSKGSPINISQMVACVGQQSVGGCRAPDGFIDRSLPHFPRKSKTPAAKGFVANSFYSGLTATEFFFHTMGGREGLVDTAVKTADTGYMARRLIKALEDLFVHYDGTVRNAGGHIVQFLYGDDGMDPAQMEGKNGFPLNFARLFLKAKATCPSPPAAADLSPPELRAALHHRTRLHASHYGRPCSASFLHSMHEFLQSAAVTPLQLRVFLDTCFSRYYSKRIEAGTAIGAIGAQSIGEPGTQMTLKTFHFAGVASMNVTLGVPRIKEIINASKCISTPIITAPLEIDGCETSARMVKGRIERTVLGQVSTSIKVVKSAALASIVIALDSALIRSAHLGIDASTVRQSITESARLRLKHQHVKVLDVRKLEITVPHVDPARLHFELHSLRNALPAVVVRGVRTVERAVITSGADGRHGLLVEGTGLRSVMGTHGIDGRRTTSNHVIEVNATLGIEAARRKIIDEIQYTMDKHGMSIDVRHMMLLADVMTFKGEVLGITRQGIQRMRDSVLMLASFEKTADHLFNASVNGRDDRIEGVSECIIMGIPMPIGTGILKVLQMTPALQLLPGPPPMLPTGHPGRQTDQRLSM